MKRQPKKETHYGKEVWVNPTTEALRREECLCLNCGNSKPGEPDHCHTAKDLYEICKRDNVAFPVTRCPRWREK